MILRRFPLALLLTLAVAACDGDPLPVAAGPVRQLNIGRWTPGPNDLAAPPVMPATNNGGRA